MSKERLIDLFYMYGADIAQKMEQIASLELFSNLEKSHTIDDIALIFNIPEGDNKFRVTLDNGYCYMISNHDLLYKLDAHIDYILDTIDNINAMEQADIKPDYNAIVDVIQAKTMNLIEESIRFIKELK